VHQVQCQDEGALCKSDKEEDKMQEMQRQQAPPESQGKARTEGLITDLSEAIIH